MKTNNGNSKLTSFFSLAAKFAKLVSKNIFSSFFTILFPKMIKTFYAVSYNEKTKTENIHFQWHSNKKMCLNSFRWKKYWSLKWTIQWYKLSLYSVQFHIFVVRFKRQTAIVLQKSNIWFQFPFSNWQFYFFQRKCWLMNDCCLFVCCIFLWCRKTD